MPKNYEPTYRFHIYIISARMDIEKGNFYFLQGISGKPPAAGLGKAGEKRAFVGFPLAIGGRRDYNIKI